MKYILKMSRMSLRALLLIVNFALISLSYAGENVLIIEPRTGFDGDQIKVELEKILAGTGASNVNVAVTRPASRNNLSLWYHYPYNDREQRMRNLRGEDGTAWDYVIILEDPEVIDTFPGWYAQGVHDVAKEVERGTGEAVVLMQWPSATSPVTATLDYYKEVSYRVGRGRDLKVIPAGLAWNAAGSPANALDAAYIAAASIYSRLWDANAKDSNYSYNDSFAQTAFTTVTQNKGVPQYSGPFTSAPNGIHRIGGNQNRVLRIINDRYITPGWPVESRNNRGAADLLTKMKIVNRLTSKEYIGGAPNLNRRGTPNDHADLHYVASHGIRPTTAGLFLFKLENYLESEHATSTAAAVSLDYNTSKDLAQLWHEGNTALRQAPPRLLLSQLVSHYQTYNLNDYVRNEVYTSYMVTLLTGRCPVELGEEYSTGHQLGYETAWRFSTLHGRAPGFKTWPSDALRMTVDPTHSETMKVAFALQPKSDVTVTVSSSEPFVGMSQQTLIFTPENYNVPQSIVINVTEGAAPLTPFDVIYTTTSEDVVYDELRESWRYQVNTPPVADSQAVTVISNQPSPIYLTGSDPNDLSNNAIHEPAPPSTEPLTYSIVIEPENGTVVINGSTAIYTPNPGFIGEDSFSFRTKDFSVFSPAVTVNITVESDGGPYARNLLINGSAELYPFTDYGWVEAKGTWRQGSPNADVAAGDLSSFLPSKNTDSELYQDVDISLYSAGIAAGIQSFTFSGSAFNNNDAARLIIEFRDGAQQVISANDSGKLTNGFYSYSYVAPVSAVTMRVRLISIRGKGSSNGAKHDALSLIAVEPVSPFVTWSNGSNFADDNNDDGISNGIAYAVGADDVSVDASALLPTAELGDDPEYYVFCYRRSDVAHNDPGTTICAEYSLDIDTWIECEEISDSNDIVIIETDDFYGTGVDKIEVKIKRSLANGGGVFCRLKVTQ